jgi:two-component system chemotaxis response regulator CheY
MTTHNSGTQTGEADGVNARTVLIVDDSPVLRALIRRALVLAGVEDELIREAGNGQEALEELEREVVDVVLLDLNMPVMDGFTFVDEKTKRAEFDHSKVIVVSTEGNEERLHELREKGISGYLRKPFEPEDLRGIIVEAIGGGAG